MSLTSEVRARGETTPSVEPISVSSSLACSASGVGVDAGIGARAPGRVMAAGALVAGRDELSRAKGRSRACPAPVCCKASNDGRSAVAAAPAACAVRGVNEGGAAEGLAGGVDRESDCAPGVNLTYRIYTHQFRHSFHWQHVGETIPMMPECLLHSASSKLWHRHQQIHNT